MKIQMKISSSFSSKQFIYNLEPGREENIYEYNGNYMGSGTYTGSTVIYKYDRKKPNIKTDDIVRVTKWIIIKIFKDGTCIKFIEINECDINKTINNKLIIDNNLEISLREIYRLDYSPFEISSIKYVYDEKNIVSENDIDIILPDKYKLKKLIPRKPVYEN